jgi:excisionase family DNA binding protein
MHDRPPLVGVSALARVLSVRRLTVYRLAEARKIPYVRVGRSLRFDAAAVVAALSVPRTATDTGEDKQ